MMHALKSFIEDRFPLKVTLPLSFVLFGAPASLSMPNLFSAVCGFTTIFLALLVLRIWDDISDLEIDAIKSPGRGLVSGRIDGERLVWASGFFLLIVLCLNSLEPAFPLVCLVMAYYLIFFRHLKKKVPFVLQPLLLNVIFFVIPLYAGLLGGHLDGKFWALSLFVWIGVVAHDYAHSVHGPEEGMEGVPSFSGSIGARGSAILAGTFFLLSACFGLVVWMLGTGDGLFVTALSCMSLLILYRCGRLLLHPSSREARPFYVSGFLFFLIPLIALGAERLLCMVGVW